MKFIKFTDMRRPMVWIALFTLGGILMSVYGLDLKITLAALLIAAIISAVLVRKSLLPLLLVLAVSSAAAVRFAYIETRARALWEKYNGAETLLTGEIYSEPTYSSDLSKVILKTELGLIELTCYRSYADVGEIGDQVTVNATLSSLSHPANDYGFNSRSYFLSRGIYLTADSNESPRLFKKGRRGLRYLA